MSTPDLLPNLPFLEKLNEKFSARAGNIFLLHGRIHDIFPAGVGRWKPLLSLLTEKLSRENRIFIQLDLSDGFKVLQIWPSSIEDLPSEKQKELTALKEEDQKKRLEKLREEHRLKEEEFLRTLVGPSPISPKTSVFDFLCQESISSFFAALTLAKEIVDSLARVPGGSSRRIIFFINDLSTIAPSQSEGNLSEYDRRNIQLLQKWFNDSDFLESRNAIIMLSETIENVNQKLRTLTQTIPIKISRPSSEERNYYIEYFLREAVGEIALDHGLTLPKLAETTAGLTIRDIEQLLRTVRFRAKRDFQTGKVLEKATLSLDTLRIRAREVLEQAAGGHIEFLESNHGLEAVIGQQRLKPRLERLAKLFRKGVKSAIPNGILVPGPNGGGKTFIFKGFTKETGWITIRLKNIRNMWYGETERIWEVIEEILEAIGNVIIMVDEGDTELGGRGRDVHEVDKRLFGKILRVMEDKKNKGRISWIIITARPDKLEPDIKRSGRAGRHYPVFAPETKEERMRFMEETVLKKFNLPFSSMDEGKKDELLQLTESYYPADFDHLVEQLEELRESEERAILLDDLLGETRAIHPPDPVLQRRLQIYVALLECTDDRLIPDQYQNLTQNREGLVRKIVELKQILGE